MDYCFRRGIVPSVALINRFFNACMALSSGDSVSVVSQAQVGFGQSVPMIVAMLLEVEDVSSILVSHIKEGNPSQRQRIL